MYTIGADPELFLQNAEGKLISAIGRFGGTKRKPKPMPELGEGFSIQEDNVAVEFNVPPTPLYQAYSFVQNVLRAVHEIEARAARMSLNVVVKASGIFSPDQLRHPKAVRFGCDPDFNVWSLCENPTPTAKNKMLRSAGGHIHVGGQVADKIGLGRALDLFVGCPSILFDDDVARRELYGAAGAIRDKPYGIEYRTPSNFWVKDGKLIRMIVGQVKDATRFVDHGHTIPDEDGRKIIQCINNSDKDILRELTAKYGLRY